MSKPVRVKKDLHKKLSDMADKQGCSMGFIIEKLVEKKNVKKNT